MNRVFAAVLAAGLLVAASGASAVEPAVTLRRFALLVGANDGGLGRPRLRYATSDAQSMARVLEELGGVSRTDAVLVLEPDRAGLSAALAGLRGRIDAARGAGQRLELVLYYSGHSDDEGLLLRGERYGYDELRRALDSMHSDVRVAILDSCSSGALTRQKGGVRRAPFLIDSAAVVRGHAFLTSSSEHEAAQESDRIQASYFTHFLISGLLGAADATSDRRVTLNEAYQYAFAETLRQTEKTKAGAQHPAYDIQMQGTGDLVMTDLRATSASLALAPELNGRFFVHDDVDRLVAELFKPAGRSLELGLGPGTYSIRLDRRDELFEASVTLREGDHLTLGAKQLERVSREVTAMRGDAAEPAESEIDHREAVGRGGPRVLRTADGEEHAIVPFSLSILPHLSTSPVGVVKTFSLNLLAGRSLRVHGLELGLGVNSVDEEVRGAQLAVAVNQIGGDLVGLQASSAINVVGGGAVGMQAAAVGNVLGGGRVMQAAGVFNVVSRDLLGMQAAGVYNQLGGSGRGLQADGVANVAAAGFTGMQAAGVMNVARGFYSGMQASGLVNYAPGLRGAQVGVINVGGDVSGAQVGVVNVADKVDGAQIGVLNLARESEVSLGLVSLVGNGQIHLDTWTSSDEALGVAFRFGSKRLYTLVFADSFRRDLAASSTDDLFGGLGVGVHFTPGPVFVDADVMWGTSPRVWQTHTSLNFNRARLTVGYPFAPHLAVFAGVAANVLVGVGTDLPAAPAQSILPFSQKVWRTGDVTVHLWPGLVLGLQL